MTNQHPITPPPELVQQWLGTYFGTTVTGEVSGVELALATEAAQWGADQELEACCKWTDVNGWDDACDELRAARRPKPPSLKEQALDALEQLLQDPEAGCFAAAPDTIRRAIEALPND
jgi:hypothetical protein